MGGIDALLELVRIGLVCLKSSRLLISVLGISTAQTQGEALNVKTVVSK